MTSLSAPVGSFDGLCGQFLKRGQSADTFPGEESVPKFCATSRASLAEKAGRDLGVGTPYCRHDRVSVRIPGGERERREMYLAEELHREVLVNAQVAALVGSGMLGLLAIASSSVSYLTLAVASYASRGRADREASGTSRQRERHSATAARPAGARRGEAGLALNARARVAVRRPAENIVWVRLGDAAEVAAVFSISVAASIRGSLTKHINRFNLGAFWSLVPRPPTLRRLRLDCSDARPLLPLRLLDLLAVSPSTGSCAVSPSTSSTVWPSTRSRSCTPHEARQTLNRPGSRST